MTPRPLYKWKSFWFGVLVVGFLGWAWARSMDRLDAFTWSGGGGEVHLQISQFNSDVDLYTGMSGYLREPGFEYEGRELHAGESEVWLPACLLMDQGQMGKSVTFAHWFLILLVLVPWSGWLAWRWRRLRRLQTKVELNP